MPGNSTGPSRSELQQMRLSQLRKTEMCKFHLMNQCQRGSNCWFAHNPSEIRDKPDLHRTSLCKAFVQNGHCNDANCKFAHSQSDLLSTSLFFKKKLCMFASAKTCRHGEACRFAHSADELAEDARADGSTSAGTQEGSGDSGQESPSPGAPRGQPQAGARSGNDPWTTLMVANVPSFMTQGAVVSFLEDVTPSMRGAFDFFFCPWDDQERRNLGYAVINFFTAAAAADFARRWDNQSLFSSAPGSRRLTIMPAAVQGHVANLRHFSRFSLALHQDPRFRPLLRVDPGGPLQPMSLPKGSRPPEPQKVGRPPRKPGFEDPGAELAHVPRGPLLAPPGLIVGNWECEQTDDCSRTGLAEDMVAGNTDVARVPHNVIGFGEAEHVGNAEFADNQPGSRGALQGALAIFPVLYSM